MEGSTLRVLITGAAGFIGSHLADWFLRNGHEVIGIDNLTTGRRENFPEHPQGTFIRGDILDTVTMKFQYQPADVIYHCAASYRDRTNWENDGLTNVLGTINVIREAQRTAAKLIYFQTSLCYGPNPISPIKVDAALNPHGSYAVSKTAGEAFIRDSGVEWVSLRLANIYGPRNLSGPIPTFYQRLTEGAEVTIVDSRRDFIYIDDLVRVATQVATAGRGIYHVSSGTDTQILSIYQAVRNALKIDDSESTPVVQPRGSDDVETILLDPMETYQELGWTARTPLVTGVHEAVKWYQAHGVTETYTHLGGVK